MPSSHASCCNAAPSAARCLHQLSKLQYVLRSVITFAIHALMPSLLCQGDMTHAVLVETVKAVCRQSESGWACYTPAE